MSKYNGKDKHELFGYMSMADDDDAPDGAWWAMLQSAAADCMGIKADDDRAFDAVHDYIAYCNTEEGARIFGRPAPNPGTEQA